MDEAEIQNEAWVNDAIRGWIGDIADERIEAHEQTTTNTITEEQLEQTVEDVVDRKLAEMDIETEVNDEQIEAVVELWFEDVVEEVTGYGN